MSPVLVTSKKKTVEAASSAKVAVSQLACDRHDAQKLSVLKGPFPKRMHETFFSAVKKKLGKGMLDSWLCGWWKLNIQARKKKGRLSCLLSLACPKVLWTQQLTNAMQSGNMCSGKAET